ncbi:hypothetical protein CN918_26395 [Priestia megaterium]|nr:hypothetical protein CN918_26395 [Priestia megaterium]
MNITSEEAFEIIKREGIATKYTTFMKMVREGRVLGTMTSKKKGYRFKRQEIEDFINRYKKDDTFNAKATIESLEEENEQLLQQLSMPKDYWMLENQRLKEMLNEAENKLKQATEELKQLKIQQDQTPIEPMKTPRKAISTSSDIKIQFNNKGIDFKLKEENDKKKEEILI